MHPEFTLSLDWFLDPDMRLDIVTGWDLESGENMNCTPGPAVNSMWLWAVVADL
jgi:hypothetical protein